MARPQPPESDSTESQPSFAAPNYQRILDNVSDLICQFDVNGITTYVSPSVTAMLGYSPDAVVGTPLEHWLSIVHPDDALSDLLRYDQIITLHETQPRSEYRIRHADGHHVWIETNAQVLRDDEGTLLGLIYVNRDITERKAHELALAESEARYRSVIAALSEGVVVVSREGRLLSGNAAAARVLGLTNDEQLVGMAPPFSATLLNEDGTPLRDEPPALRAIRTGEPQHNQVMGVQTPDGEIIWISVNAQPLVHPGETDAYAAVASFTDITEARAATAAMRLTQHLYHTLINSFDGIVWEADPRTFHIQFVSSQLEQLLGYPVETALSRPTIWQRRMLPDDYARIAQLVRQAIATQQGYETEYRMIATDGRLVWFRERVSITTESTGSPRAIGTMIDISDYKRAQAAEREQRALAEALEQTAEVLTSTLDLDDVLDQILRQLAQVVPHDTADILLIEGDEATLARTKGYTERGIANAMHGLRMRVNDFATLRTMLDTGMPLIIEDRLTYPGWVNLSLVEAWIRSYLGAPIRLEGRTIGFLNLNSEQPSQFTAAHAAHLEVFAHQAAIAIRNARLFADLERRVAERTAELALERTRLRVILDATGEGIFYTEGMTIQYVNHALCRLTGYGARELLGMSVKIFSPTATDEDTLLKAMLRVLRQGVISREEARLMCKDGTTFDAGLTTSLIGEPGGEMLRTVTVVRDISEEKALQAQKARFVAHASHELRTPLTNLITRLYLLRRMPHRLNEHLEVLEEVSGRMRRLVEDLLDLSRFERGTIALRQQRVILQELVWSVVRVQEAEATQKQIALHCDAPHAPLTIIADPDRIVQVITNLVANAINYTLSGGDVTVRVMQDTPDAGLPTHVLVVVEDTGIGIAAEHLPHIFLPFYRVLGEQEGTGLGLSVAHEIVALHGGQLTVESEPGRGSRFIVRLALAGTLTTKPHPQANE